MKTTFLTLLSLIFLSISYGQTANRENKINFYDSIPAIVEEQLFKIELLNIPAFIYEKAISNNSTIYGSLALGYGASVSNGSQFDVFTNALFPTLEVQFRHYYNLDKRKTKFKNITNNSGQYVAAKVEAFKLVNSVDGLNNYDRYGIGGVWGFQKNGKPLTFNFEMGLGYLYHDYNFTFYPSSNKEGFSTAFLGKLQIGFLIGPHSKKYKEYLKM